MRNRFLIEVPWDGKGIFKERVNKFLGIVNIVSPRVYGDTEVHIHDPGRLCEILYPGNKVLLKRVKKERRKTEWRCYSG